MDENDQVLDIIGMTVADGNVRDESDDSNREVEEEDLEGDEDDMDSDDDFLFLMMIQTQKMSLIFLVSLLQGGWY